MKKITVSILIIMIIFNLIQPIAVYATDTPTSTPTPISPEEAKGKMDSFLNEGKMNLTTSGKNRNEILTYSPVGGSIGAGILAQIGNLIALNVVTAISSAVILTDDGLSVFSIYDAVFDRINIFSVNFFKMSSSGDTIHDTIAKAVTQWYYAIRNIAIIISLVTLLYIGIRMAISTLADDKAKYKKMLFSWIQAFILIFIMHYIILISINLAGILIDILKQLAENSIQSLPSIYKINNGFQLEVKMMMDAFISTYIHPGWDSIPYSILFWILAYYQFKFFFLYIKRMLSVAFLIIISPLITVTYPIDKINDNKAQAFGAWITEFEVNIFVQPLHALLYLIFIVSATAIAIKAPLLAAIFFMALSRGEKVIKSIFGARGMKSIHSMGKGKGKKK